LREVGRLVRESIRNMVDSAFRYGGDEFVVILTEESDEDGVGRVIEW
jgi:GGDEF domain-containing protein